MIRNGSAHKSQSNGTLWIHIFLIAFTGLTLFPILGGPSRSVRCARRNVHLPRTLP